MGEPSYFLTTGFGALTQPVVAAPSRRRWTANQGVFGLLNEKFYCNVKNAFAC
jgi:hypothetical protein